MPTAGQLPVTAPAQLQSALRHTVSSNDSRNRTISSARLDRERLEIELQLIRAASLTTESPRQPTFRTPFHPPSTSPIAQLRPIAIAELTLDSRHVGRVLFARCFGEPVRLIGVLNNVEDQDGDVARLVLNNAGPNISPDELLPWHALLAIKEPYYRSNGDVSPCICVEQPSDVIALRPDNRRLPAALRPPRAEAVGSATDLKTSGNAAVIAKKLRLALTSYTQALEICRDDEQSVKHDILRNRALVHLNLHCFEAARADAIASLTSRPAGSPLTKSDAKAYYQAGCASYKLGSYKAADGHFRAALGFAPEDRDVARQLTLCAERRLEQSIGEYDLTRMIEGTSLAHRHLDCADYSLKTEICSAGACGRGLFASQPIAAGEIVLVEKAFSTSFGSDTAGLSMNPNDRLLFDSAHILRCNPGHAARLMDLCDGGYASRVGRPAGGTLPIIDGAVVVDMAHVQAIIDRNAFGCPTLCSTRGHPAVERDGGGECMGIWPRASYINHACISNAARSFIGDVMLVRATRSLAAGTEILIAYRPPAHDVAITQQRLQNTWGFRCTCPLCTAETSISTPIRRLRSALAADLATFLAAHDLSLPDTTRVQPAAIATAEHLLSRLEAAYHPTAPAFPALVELGSWLSKAHLRTTPPQPDRALAAAIAALRAAGCRIRLQFSAPPPSAVDDVLDASDAWVTGLLVDVAVQAAFACACTGRVAMGRRLEGFARVVYCMVMGSLDGFGLGDKPIPMVAGA